MELKIPINFDKLFYFRGLREYKKEVEYIFIRQNPCWCDPTRVLWLLELGAFLHGREECVEQSHDG